jgi:hypothetical protein
MGFASFAVERPSGGDVPTRNATFSSSKNGFLGTAKITNLKQQISNNKSQTNHNDQIANG